MTKIRNLPLWIVLGVVVVLVLWLVGAYNGFIRLGEGVNTAWSQVENQYQRRFDLVPNLVETVKGIAQQEQTVFLGVTQARAQVGQLTVTPETLSDPQLFSKFQAAQDSLSSALSRLLAVAENYPQIKSNENFLALQDQLEGTENRIATERMRYNESVQSYNVRAKAIPGRWLVGIFGLPGERQLFKAVEGAAVPVQVNFGN